MKGENVQVTGGRVQVGGQVAVMEINGLLVRRILEKNQDRPAFLEEAFPIDLLKEHLEPCGPIFKLHHSPQTDLPAACLEGSRRYWTSFLTDTLGRAAAGADSTAAVCDFVERRRLGSDPAAFDGSPTFLDDEAARQQFAQLRLAQARHFAWRASQSEDPGWEQTLLTEATLAFQQAWMLWPDPSNTNWPRGSPASRHAEFLREPGSASDVERLSRAVESLSDPP